MSRLPVSPKRPSRSLLALALSLGLATALLAAQPARTEQAAVFYISPDLNEAYHSMTPGKSPVTGKELVARPLTAEQIAAVAERLLPLIEASAKDGNWATGRPRVWRMVSLKRLMQQVPPPKPLTEVVWKARLTSFDTTVTALETAGEAKDRAATTEQAAKVRESLRSLMGGSEGRK